MRARRSIVWIVGFLGIIALPVLFLSVPAQERSLSDLEGNAERGAYVVRLAACISCHTRSGGALLAGGAAIKTPYGDFFAPNITPDSENGIGDWTLSEFAEALLNGTSPNGSHYFPVFPYTSYSKLTDQDIVDLWAYIRTVPPSSAPSEAHSVSAPFGWRFLLAPWKMLFFSPAPLEIRPDRSEGWNRGAYIVLGPGHCVECHTPRDVLGNLDRSRLLKGSKTGPGGEIVPAITTESLIANGWTERGIVFGLSSGFMANGDSFSGSMGEVIRDSTKHLTDEDRRAIAEFLLSGINKHLYSRWD